MTTRMQTNRYFRKQKWLECSTVWPCCKLQRFDPDWPHRHRTMKSKRLSYPCTWLRMRYQHRVELERRRFRFRRKSFCCTCAWSRLCRVNSPFRVRSIRPKRRAVKRPSGTSSRGIDRLWLHCRPVAWQPSCRRHRLLVPSTSGKNRAPLYLCTMHRRPFPIVECRTCFRNIWGLLLLWQRPLLMAHYPSCVTWNHASWNSPLLHNRLPVHFCTVWIYNEKINQTH